MYFVICNNKKTYRNNLEEKVEKSEKSLIVVIFELKSLRDFTTGIL